MKIQDYRGAIADFEISLKIDANQSSVYLARGVCKIGIGMKESGCLDLSKAGELGEAEAYDIIKQYCQ